MVRLDTLAIVMLVAFVGYYAGGFVETMLEPEHGAVPASAEVELSRLASSTYVESADEDVDDGAPNGFATVIPHTTKSPLQPLQPLPPPLRMGAPPAKRPADGVPAVKREPPPEIKAVDEDEDAAAAAAVPVHQPHTKKIKLELFPKAKEALKAVPMPHPAVTAPILMTSPSEVGEEVTEKVGSVLELEGMLKSLSVGNVQCSPHHQTWGIIQCRSPSLLD